MVMVIATENEMAKATWNVMTVTRKGTVSLIKNLTENEARGVMQRLRRPFDEGDPWSDYKIQEQVKREVEYELGVNPQPQWGQSRMCQDGDLEEIECWSSDGKTMGQRRYYGGKEHDLPIWPKPDDYDARYAAALDAERARALAEPTT
jgi:hypothetical protein